MGRWQWQSVRPDHQPLCDYLLSQQPLANTANAWLNIVAELAVHGKHIDLVPQKRIEQRVTTVEKAGASMSWGQSDAGSFIGFGPGGSIEFGPGGVIAFGPQGVSFDGDVRAMGSPIDPRTQRVVPSADVSERLEIWVSFKIEGYDVRADQFCKQACQETRRIVQEMTDQFALS
jgi:hypothetical protein